MKTMVREERVELLLAWNELEAPSLDGTFWFSTTQDNRAGRLRSVTVTFTVTPLTDVDTAYSNLSLDGYVQPVGAGSSSMELQSVSRASLAPAHDVILDAVRAHARMVQARMAA